MTAHEIRQIDPVLLDRGVAHLRAVDPRMAELIDRVGPCTLTLRPDLFEALVHSIVSQQISTKAKEAIMARIHAYYAPAITPESLLSTPDDDLRALGCSRAKVAYLKDLSARVADSSLDLNRLPGLADEAIIEELVQVKGIGRWTAEMLLIFALGRLDVWPVDDLGIVVGVQLLYDLPARLPARQLHVYGEPFRPYRSIASWYLWRVKTAPPIDPAISSTAGRSE